MWSVNVFRPRTGNTTLPGGVRRKNVTTKSEVENTKMKSLPQSKVSVTNKPSRKTINKLTKGENDTKKCKFMSFYIISLKIHRSAYLRSCKIMSNSLFFSKALLCLYSEILWPLLAALPAFENTIKSYFSSFFCSAFPFFKYKLSINFK